MTRLRGDGAWGSTGPIAIDGLVSVEFLIFSDQPDGLVAVTALAPHFLMFGGGRLVGLRS
ncbi:uncharacterized protein ColSpa_09369 [Colletotrichum spaethianum]|uniref:Uncharacterized protein n=1 Tax=Colletotrichum spaethianum TaxID=700344 RepID=A0AA37US27_9PEZI|nr:uncharacterized protein ColSpa_09369 [Colletotrichum spaethianum]GKT49188.1 hypothetical protein ColSpa_09369 [Colletotrichum spaethianum]